MDINKRLDELVGLNMLRHTRENERAIGNHLIAVREYIEKQDETIAIYKKKYPELEIMTPPDAINAWLEANK